jgi:hypothetical protein
MNWGKAYTDQLPEAAVSDGENNTEMDVFYTFVGAKKPGLHFH